MSMSPEEAQFKMSFQISPIILTNGIADQMSGGLLPIIAITQADDYENGLLSSAVDIDLDDFFAAFRPAAGSKLISNQYGRYPFANQQVAANAVIVQMLNVSLIMDIPVREGSSYFDKLSKLSGLRAALSQHALLGGTYTVVTPGYMYTNCLLLDLHDVSGSGTKQVQFSYQWDFEQPLLTLDQAEQAQNSLMGQITNATAINGDPAWSGPSTTVGQPPSLAAPSVIPSGGGASGSGVSGQEAF